VVNFKENIEQVRFVFAMVIDKNHIVIMRMLFT